MSRITLHLKRFAHRTTTVSSTHRPAAAGAVRPHAFPHTHTHTHELSVLQAAPPGSAWSTILESGSSECESFALESLSQTQTVQQQQSASVPGDKEALDPLMEVGDEEVAGV